MAWVSLFIALGLWELSALLLQPTLTTDSYAHPTISVLTDPVLATHLGRSIALFAWLAKEERPIDSPLNERTTSSGGVC